MKSDRIKKVAGTVGFILMFALVLNGVSRLLERKTSEERYSEFWEQPGDYDVWLIGNSHIYYAVQPMELWKDYRIRSYNLGAPRSYMPQMYWTLLNALSRATPKVVVVECYYIEKESKMADMAEDENQSLLHDGFDSIPFSPMKVKAVMDLFDTKEQRIEYLFDFYVYHNRWEELEEEDFMPSYGTTKGAILSAEVDGQNPYQIIDETDMLQEETLGYEYLRKMIEACREKGVSVVLASVPCSMNENSQRAINGVQKLSKEYGAPFLNMSYDDELTIDYRTDFKDSGHMNYLGAKKVTEYIGKYLSEAYEVSIDEGKEEGTAKAWDEDYEMYSATFLDLMKEEQSLVSYLVWLNNENYECEIFQEKGLDPESKAGIILNKIRNKRMISKEEAVLAIGEFQAPRAFLVKDAKTGEVIDTAVFEKGKRVEGL